MRQANTKASILSYLGAMLLLVGLYPVPDAWLERMPAVHSLWHLWLFIGAALLIYGLETLRRLARRSRHSPTR